MSSSGLAESGPLTVSTAPITPAISPGRASHRSAPRSSAASSPALASSIAARMAEGPGTSSAAARRAATDSQAAVSDSSPHPRRDPAPVAPAIQTASTPASGRGSTPWVSISTGAMPPSSVPTSPASRSASPGSRRQLAASRKTAHSRPAPITATGSWPGSRKRTAQPDTISRVSAPLPAISPRH